MTSNLSNEQGKKEESVREASVYSHVGSETMTCLRTAKPKLFSKVGQGEKPKLFSEVGQGEKAKLFSEVGLDKTSKDRLFTEVSPEELMTLPVTDGNQGLEEQGEAIGTEEKAQVRRQLTSKKPQLFSEVNKEWGIDLPAMDSESKWREQDIRNVTKNNSSPSQPTVVTNGLVDSSQDWKNFELRLLQTICKRYDTQDGEQSVILYRFQIQIEYEFFDAVVKADEVGNIKWLKCATHGKAFVRKSKSEISFDEYVSNVIIKSNVREQTQYFTNGWKLTKSGTWMYVLGDGCIGNICPDICGNPKSVFEYDKEKVGSKEVFREALGMLNMSMDKTLTIPLFIFTHAGVLTRLFEEAGHPIKFLIAVIGETNSRKTSLSLCMTKLFNRKEIQLPEITFNSTEGGIEKKVGLNPDTVLVIDDFMPAQTKAKQRILDTKLEKIVRMYGERKSVERMTDFAKNPNAGYYPIRNIAVITGEQIRGVQSSLTRSLILRIGRNSVENDKLSFYQQNYKILNTHIYDFIQFIVMNQKRVMQFISRKVEEYRRESKFEVPRYSEMYAILMTVTEIFISYASERQFISEAEGRAIYMAWNNSVLQVIERNMSELKENNLLGNISQVLQSLIENGRTYPLPKEEQRNYGDLIFEDEDYIYIRMDTLLKEMRSYSALWGYEVPNITKQMILNELENAEMIETRGKSEGKRTLKLPESKVNGQRFLYVRKDKIQGLFLIKKAYC